jgi:hypothetical protein
MRRLKFGLFALVALVAAFAATAVSASAALPEFTVETPATSSQTVTSTFENPGAGLLEGTITSTSLTSELKPTSKQLGTFHITFKESKCKTALGKGSAESEGDAAGIILVLGVYHIVNVAAKPYAWLLLEPVHITCLLSLGNVLLVVSGNVLGSLSPVGSKTKSYSLTIKATSGKQEITEFENNEGGKVKAELVTTVGEKSGPSTQNESAAVGITAEKETELT